MPECPRWRLLQPHYLNVDHLPDGTKIEYEHKETNRESGRAVRKMFVVPVLLDPRDASDHNYPGDIIVAQIIDGHSAPLRQDIIFTGVPTPDMEPLNEAAEAISAEHRQRWEHPIDTLPINGGMDDREKAFMENMMKAFVGAGAAAANATVPQAQYDELKNRLAKLEVLLAQQSKTEAPQRRA